MRNRNRLGDLEEKVSFRGTLSGPPNNVERPFAPLPSFRLTFLSTRALPLPFVILHTIFLPAIFSSLALPTMSHPVCTPSDNETTEEPRSLMNFRRSDPLKVAPARRWNFPIDGPSIFRSDRQSPRFINHRREADREASLRDDARNRFNFQIRCRKIYLVLVPEDATLPGSCRRPVFIYLNRRPVHFS